VVLIYSDIGNQLANLIKYGFAFTIVFVLWPCFIFKDRKSSGLDGYISRYIKMVCLVIAIVYLLAAVKLFEFFSFFIILLMITIYVNFFKKNPAGAGVSPDILSRIFDYFEGRLSFRDWLTSWYHNRVLILKDLFVNNFNNLTGAGTSILFIAVFVFSAYLRFFDSFTNAAPAMSDAYVTLAWMKYIGQNLLFRDGIYPQGNCIYLAVLFKFCNIDPLYVLKYTGPLNGVLVTLSIYFFVSRITGRVLPGIVSAFMFGVLGGLIPIEFERQASTNAQEFALVFLLPAWYYSARYLQTKNKNDLTTAAAALIATGWIHSLVFAFAGMGFTVILLVGTLLDFKHNIKNAWFLSLAGGLAVFLSVLPAAIGLALGLDFHSASAAFLTAQREEITYPAISPVDKIALAGLLAFMIVSVFTKKVRKDFIFPLFIFLFGAASFILYIYYGPLSGNPVLMTRSGLLWSMIICTAVGLAWYAVYRTVLANNKLSFAEVLLCAALIVFPAAYYHPAPIIPYKMEHNSTVEQYLRISREYLPGQWMIVSEEEGYAVVLGRSWHLMLGDFLNFYDPDQEKLVREENGQKIFPAPDIFIYKEKNMFRPDFDTYKEILARREKEYDQLDRWLDKYQAKHDNISIYYEDNDKALT